MLSLIAHTIFRLDTGGLENGLVNLINRMPGDRYRHAIICLSDYTEFRERIQSPDVSVIELNKCEGKDIGIYVRLWLELRRLRPNIVHTRNLGTVDMVIPAYFAGIRHRIHGEQGWDMVDLHGKKKKYLLVRKICEPFISQYVTVSGDLADWLRNSVGVSGNKIVTICNAVDAKRLAPRVSKSRSQDKVVIGTVGRLAEVKDQLSLVRAFAALLNDVPEPRLQLQLAIIGDGPMRETIEATVVDLGLCNNVWMPGRQDRIEDVLRTFDLFVLPPLNEGFSNTILEAMATGLPVIASNFGGNPELIDDGLTGSLVPASDPAALAKSLERYLMNPCLVREHGRNGRWKCERKYGIDKMVARYSAVYKGAFSVTRRSSHFSLIQN